MLYCVSFASLAVIVALTAAGRTDKSFYGTCTFYAVTKTFTLERATSNDTCTITLPSFQCGGFCETEVLFSSKAVTLNDNGVYELGAESKCKCCEPVKSTMERTVIKAGNLPCKNNDLMYDKRIVLDIIKECHCRTCKSSVVL